jgi:hypothetical protein
MHSYILVVRPLSKHLAEHHWYHIQKRMQENIKQIKNAPYWKDIKWVLKTDFFHIKQVKAPFLTKNRIRCWLAGFRFYRALHDVKKKFRG